jgi:acyl-CoA synthetase (NDP forming)
VPLLAGVAARSEKPVVGVVDGGRLFDPMRDAFIAAGIPVFAVCDRAVAAIAMYIESRLCADGIRNGTGV